MKLPLVKSRLSVSLVVSPTAWICEKLFRANDPAGAPFSVTSTLLLLFGSISTVTLLKPFPMSRSSTPFDEMPLAVTSST